MIAMLDTSDDLVQAAKEIGCEVEQLLTPLTLFNRQDRTRRFAIDNGAYARFRRKRFLGLLEREAADRHLCRFVAVPDVVGSAIRTRELFNYWYPQLCRWPLAYVCQDGQESLPIPWTFRNQKLLAAVFIGGSTEWKLSQHAAAIIKTAKAMDVWVHVGRVNTPGRFEHFQELGADSIDGSGLARFSWMRQRIYDQQHNPSLFSGLQALEENTYADTTV